MHLTWSGCMVNSCQIWIEFFHHHQQSISYMLGGHVSPFVILLSRPPAPLQCWLIHFLLGWLPCPHPKSPIPLDHTSGPDPNRYRQSAQTPRETAPETLQLSDSPCPSSAKSTKHFSPHILCFHLVTDTVIQSRAYKHLKHHSHSGLRGPDNPHHSLCLECPISLPPVPKWTQKHVGHTLIPFSDIFPAEATLRCSLGNIT